MADYKNQQELLKAHEKLKAEFDMRWSERGISAALDEMRDLESVMGQPDFWDDADKAREVSVKKSDMEKRCLPWRELKSELEDFPDLVELTIEEFDEPREAIESLVGDFTVIGEKFEALLMSEALTGEDDNRNAIITITCGAGGTESQDWAEMLNRMYMRWFEKRGFKTELVDLQPGEEAGLKSSTIFVKGANAFGYLKSENGIHRLVRISPFDSNKRRHTSFASVHITPDIDDSIKVDIEKKDLREDTYRASGAGGQHVNKTDSAIRLTHIPSGVVVQCQNERSQHKNRATAMKMLEARLHQLEKERKSEELESRSGEKREVGWGSQIRSYVFHPYKMVKDLRTSHETGNVDAVMNGELDPFVNSYLKSLATGSFNPAVETADD